MRKILILDDNERLLKRLAENIRKFEVVTAITVDDALKILLSKDISFLAVDYDLGNEKTGDMLYELLFKSGKSVPAIVFSGKDLSAGTKRFLEEKGFSNILSKVDDEHAVSELIEETADSILQSCEARIFHVRKKVLVIGVGGNPLKFNGVFKTIDEWMDSMAECNHTETEEKELKELIIKYCLASRKRMDEYDFPS